MTRIFDEDLKASFGTRAIHAGQRPDLLSGAIMTPIYTTSTYVQEGLGKNKGYEYARGKNPTREALERNVAALEGGTHGFAFSSGMGATTSIMMLFKSGDHIVAGESSYGGTFRLFDKILRNFGLSFSYVDSRDPQKVEDACTKNTAAIMMETPTNPMMRITDLSAVGQIAKRKKALFIVDNTFASPYFQRPFEHGADIVYHSSTKYLNGHSDMVGVSRSSGTMRSRSACSSLRTPRAQCLVPSMRGWCSAERRRFTCACRVTTRTDGRSRLGWPRRSVTRT